MKVTVNFGSVRVIVPCGKGDLPVKKLMDLAVTRYKKATGKAVDSWVTIHNLKLLSDGGILDPDDKLNDVADDREQIAAVFDEELAPYLLQGHGGDGTSASSVGTDSPDLFAADLLSLPVPLHCEAEDKLAGLLPLHVRRGSEPALNSLSPQLLPGLDPCKRWSAAIVASEGSYKRLNSEGEEQSEDELPPGEREDGSGEEKSLTYCNSWTQELCFNNDQRKEPLGGPISSPKLSSTDEAEDSDSSSVSHSKIEIMKLKKEDGPLGIRIIPADESPDKNNGVIIQGIEPGGRIDRDGRFCVGDRITEINGHKLSRDSYRNAHEILKDAIQAPELSIHCIKKNPENINAKGVPPPTPPKPSVFASKGDDGESMDEDEKVQSNTVPPMPLLTPTKKLLANVLLKGSPGHSSIRKIGRRILVHLTKGSEGLGFSITSKDPSNGPPFYIKNILPAGAAINDGRLQTGDKLLEVNKQDVSNLTQSEVLGILRKVPFGEVAELVISRQETDLSPSPSLPRQLPPEKCGEEPLVISAKKRDVFTYEVPLNDTGSAGLGVSVKGRTSNTHKGPVDMGIFLKNIFHGGAAHKDGRLRMNDQLLKVNGISLLEMTNGQAMETLRRAMIQIEGPTVLSHAIILTVARRKSSNHNPDNSGESSGHDRSDSLLSESGDSFYVSNDNLSLIKSDSGNCVSPNDNLLTRCDNGVTPDTSTSDNSQNTVIFMSMSHKSLEQTLLEEMADKQSHSEPCAAETMSVRGNSVSSSKSVSPQKRDSERSEQSLLLDLIDLHGSHQNSINHESSIVAKENGYRKMSRSFKQQTTAEVYQPANGHVNARTLNNCDNQSYSKRKRFIADRSENFKRSGMGRQSMPERKFPWAYPQSPYSPNGDVGMNGISRLAPSPVLHSSPHHSQGNGQVMREMPVDVGNFETPAIPKDIKPHRKGACNSPDCPYHAVPTRRESGSSGEQLNSVGPALGLVKSSSLESLQTMLQEQNRRGGNVSVANGNASGRGCNESFRAAVDKSFDATAQSEDPASLPNGSVPHSNVKNHTRAKTVESTEKKEGKTHKKKGLFRGLGSVFGFGKSKKKNKDSSPASKPIENGHTHPSEQERLLCQHQELIERQRERHGSRLSFTFPRHRNIPPVPSSPAPFPPSPQSREERMFALRLEHQKRHKQRNGFYPKDEEEEIYEKRLKDTDDVALVNRPLPPVPHNQSISRNSPQANAFDLSPMKRFEAINEMSKPGSRKGFVDPKRYSHYMNFQEIQQHLQQFRGTAIFPTTSETYPQNSFYLRESSSSPSKRIHRHTVSGPRIRPASEFISDSRRVELNSLRSASGNGSLPKRMFQNGRQRPPIPAEFMQKQGSRDSGYVDREYQAQLGSGSKV